MTDFREIKTSDSLDNIFNDIAREANITVKDAKRNIEIHGSSPILLVRNYLLGNDSLKKRSRISASAVPESSKSIIDIKLIHVTNTFCRVWLKYYLIMP